MPTKDELIALAKETALANGLDPALVCAVCEQESGWNPSATRFEPAFKARYIDSMGLSEPEATYRATSYGLCQIMGEVAREFGLLADIPTSLADPATNLAFGCKILKHKINVNGGGSVPKGLAAYNGGANTAYAPMVLARVAKYQTNDIEAAE